MLAEPGAVGLTIRLLRSDEPLPLRPPLRKVSQQQQRDLARVMLEKLWAAGDHARMYQAIAAMALIDSKKAEQWAAGFGPEIQEALRSMTVMAASDANLDDLIGLLPSDGPRAVMILANSPSDTPSTTRPRISRCAEEGIVRARGLNQPERADALAFFVALVSRLDKRSLGRKLIEEAWQIAARLPAATPTSMRIRGEVAAAIAGFDLQKAVALLEPIPDRNQRVTYPPKLPRPSA